MKQLIERLRKLTETQIEGGNELQEVLDGTWTEENGNTLADVVIPNIDKLSEAQLVDILNNAYNMDKGNTLYPSAFDTDKFDKYPAKLAIALSKTREAENLTDIYNVYYAGRDEYTFKEAIDAWKQEIYKDPQSVYAQLKAVGNDEDDAMADARLFEVLKKDHADLIEFLVEYLEDVNPTLLELIRKNMNIEE